MVGWAEFGQHSGDQWKLEPGVVWSTHKATQMLANQRVTAISGTRAFSIPSLCSHVVFTSTLTPCFSGHVHSCLVCNDVLKSVDWHTLLKSDTLQNRTRWRRRIQRKPCDGKCKDNKGWRWCHPLHCSHPRALDIDMQWIFQRYSSLFLNTSTHQLEVLRFVLCIQLCHSYMPWRNHN